MNADLFNKLLELKIIKTGAKVKVEVPQYDDLKKIGTVKGEFEIKEMSSHPLIPGIQIMIEHGDELLVIDRKMIKMIDGEPPVKRAAMVGIRPDGKPIDAPKRRGRKPKVRIEEENFTGMEDDDDEEDEMILEDGE